MTDQTRERIIDAQQLRAGYSYTRTDGRTTRHAFTVIRKEGERFVVVEPTIPPSDPVAKG
jgi:hypothetical protein